MCHVKELIPISRIAHRYYLYDLEHIKQCREVHNILGVFVGTLPQYNQQNVFLGIPQELMAEEARLLVERGVAFIVDDVHMHHNELPSLDYDERQVYLRALRKRGKELAEEDTKKAEESTRHALERMSLEQREMVQAKLDRRTEDTHGRRDTASHHEGFEERDTESLLPSGTLSSPLSEPCAPTGHASNKPPPRPRLITPTKWHPPIPVRTRAGNIPAASVDRPRSTYPPDSHSVDRLPPVDSLPLYALYKYLNSFSYFQSPGLRFGCQLCVYPGDPLRFHSHFLARGYAWNESIDLLNLVGGGRLGTGVKKGFLIGGPVEKRSGPGRGVQYSAGETGASGDVRTFCIEWAGM